MSAWDDAIKFLKGKRPPKRPPISREDIRAANAQRKLSKTIRAWKP